MKSIPHGMTNVSPISATTNLPIRFPSSCSPSPSQRPDTPISLRRRPNSTLVPLASSASQNVPQWIPTVRSAERIRWMSSESEGEQWSEEVRVYWSSERERRVRRKGREEPVESGRRERLNGE